MNNDDFIDCIVRTFLLYIIGCTLSENKISGSVKVYYLTPFKDLGRVNEYA